MSVIKAMLDDVVFAFARTRQVGHSKTAINAVGATEGARLVVHDMRTAHLWRDQYGINAITVADLSPSPGEGVIIFDNYAIVQMCQMASTEIKTLTKERDKLRAKIAQVKAALS